MNLYRTKLSEKLKESLEAVVPIIAIVLILTGGGDVDDTNGREDRNPDRTVKKAVGDHRVVFCTWIYHHNIGTGSAGAGRAGTFGIKYDTDSGGCRGSRKFSGGVTTGPMTVPFIMALGIGFSAVRSDKYAETDSFGLVSLCSIGPVLAVLLLGIIYHPQGGSYSETVIPDAETSVALWKLFESGIPHRWLTASDHSVLHILSGGIPEIKKENADQKFGRYPVYIHWTGIIPDRGKCRIYAGR